MNIFVFIGLWLFIPEEGIGKPKDILRVCPITKVVNSSKLEWNKHDDNTLKTAKNRCGEIYHDAPCVKFFEKYAFQSYRVVCGAKK